MKLVRNLLIVCFALIAFSGNAQMIKDPTHWSFEAKKTSDKKNDKIIVYWKLLFYTLVISIVLFSILYFLRNKSIYIGKIFKTDDN